MADAIDAIHQAVYAIVDADVYLNGRLMQSSLDYDLCPETSPSGELKWSVDFRNGLKKSGDLVRMVVNGTEAFRG